jgi:uncharacterized phage protein gp47/JayE
MALDPFPIPTRSELEQTALTLYRARLPTADTSQNSQPAVDSKQLAALLAPVYQYGVRTYRATSLQGKRGDQLDDELAARDDAREPEAGASGQVIIGAATGGAEIQPNWPIVINGKNYAHASQIAVLYPDQALVPIYGIDTGPDTDQPGGATGTWANGILGLVPTATVYTRPDGRGLVGGANEESDDDVIRRLAYENANPAASGNEAEYIRRVLRTPGVAVEAAFAYPAIQGSDTLCVVFTMRVETPGESRVPDPTAIAKVRAWTIGGFPADDRATFGAVDTNPVSAMIQVDWNGTDWADGDNAWPPFSDPPTIVVGAVAPTATTFRLAQAPSAPAPGQTLAFYDPVNAVFQPKRILTVTAIGGGVYDIVCDTTAGATDTTYTPAVNQPIGPWSDGLNALPEPTIAAFRTLGPGEQVASFWDAGSRQKRVPAPTATQWPFVVKHKLLEQALDPLDILDDVDFVAVLDSGGLVQAIPYTTPVGNPGVSSVLTELLYIVVYPES